MVGAARGRLFFATILRRPCSAQFHSQARMYGAMEKRFTTPQKSMKLATQEAMKSNVLSNDVGLTPGTFVMPTGNRKPSFFELPKQRAKLEWFRLKKRLGDFRGVLYYKWFLVKKPNPKPRLALFDTGRVAQALHRQMYTAFAEGDVSTLTSICTDGILTSFTSRIAVRPRNRTLRWTLEKYTKRPRVVSHTAIILPMFKGTAIRQAIVRLQARQSLTEMSDGKHIPGTGVGKEVSEYVVIQRRIWKEREEPWMVWGTIEESDWKAVIEQ